jgi:protein JSN1
MPLKHLQNGMEAKPLHSTGTAFLRDLKKKFDSGEKLKDFDAAFNYLFPQIVDLSIDTLGNTVVQRFIERATVKQRKRIIEEYAAQLPAVGVHKNGTYVVQKILEHSVDCPEQVNMLVSTLLPYIILLMADPFGNYVVQGCLRLPYNQFVFEIMYTHCLSIGQLKFGARSMRACLESLHATKEQLVS